MPKNKARICCLYFSITNAKLVRIKRFNYGSSSHLKYHSCFQHCKIDYFYSMLTLNGVGDNENPSYDNMDDTLTNMIKLKLDTNV